MSFLGRCKGWILIDLPIACLLSPLPELLQHGMEILLPKDLVAGFLNLFDVTAIRAFQRLFANMELEVRSA
jgi:hypothetical protein